MLQTVAGFPIIELRSESADQLAGLDPVGAAYQAARPPCGLVAHFLSESEPPGRRFEHVRKWGEFYRGTAGAFPVFFVWSSSMHDVIDGFIRTQSQDNVFTGFRRCIGRILGQRYSPATVHRGSDGTAPGEDPAAPPPSQFDTEDPPLDERQQFWTDHRPGEADVEQALRTDGLLQSALVAVSEWKRNPDPEICPTRLNDSAIDRLPVLSPGSRGLVEETLAFHFSAKILEIILTIGKRWYQGRDHGFHATIVEELVRALFLDRLAGACREHVKEGIEHAFSHGGPGAAAIDQILAGASATSPVTMVGQGFGAEGAQHCLRRLWNRPSPYTNTWLALIAPATDFSTLNLTLDQGCGTTNLKGARTYGLADENEKADSFAGLLYPLSLLYFTSGVLEKDSDTPLLGMHRFHERRDPYSTIQAISKFLKLSQTYQFEAFWGPNSPATNAARHVAWHTDVATHQSLAKFIASGRNCGG